MANLKSLAKDTKIDAAVDAVVKSIAQKRLDNPTLTLSVEQEKLQKALKAELLKNKECPFRVSSENISDSPSVITSEADPLNIANLMASKNDVFPVRRDIFL